MCLTIFHRDHYHNNAMYRYKHHYHHINVFCDNIDYFYDDDDGWMMMILMMMMDDDDDL